MSEDVTSEDVTSEGCIREGLDNYNIVSQYQKTDLVKRLSNIFRNTIVRALYS